MFRGSPKSFVGPALIVESTVTTSAVAWPAIIVNCSWTWLQTIYNILL